MNIDIELIEKQISNLKKDKNSENNKKPQKNKKKTTKICIYDFFSANEIEICEKIKEIPYFSQDFSIIEDYHFIKIGEMSERSRQLLQTIDKDENNIQSRNNQPKKEKKYLLIQYKEEKSINFADFLFKFNTPKTFIFHILNSYSALLDIIIKLDNNDICFFDLSSENIFFRENGKPFLKSFCKSVLLNKLNETYISKIIPNITDYTCKPLEVYVLFYLIMNNEETLSYHFIETIVSFFIDNMVVLTLFTEKYRESYKKECVDYLKKYINRPKSEIISDLLVYYETWDNYSLSIIYLHIIGNIIRTFGLKDNFMGSFLKLLAKNICPNPLKRESMEKTRTNFEELFSHFTNWDFINDISPGKMKKLAELL